MKQYLHNGFLRPLAIVGVAAVLLTTGACRQPSEPVKDPKAPSVELKTVDHKELLEVIAGEKGNVVLVDFWASFCPPCRENFPKVVRIEKQNAEGGLKVISVSLDPLSDKDKAIAFLSQHPADFTNLLLDEPIAVYQKEWRTKYIPAYFVFDTNGAKVGQFTAESGYAFEDVEALVRSLCGAKK